MNEKTVLINAKKTMNSLPEGVRTTLLLYVSAYCSEAVDAYYCERTSEAKDIKNECYEVLMTELDFNVSSEEFDKLFQAAIDSEDWA